jgi:catechol 2,3-dioxygenase-like lactoylglutathione lyase family enzyme
MTNPKGIRHRSRFICVAYVVIACASCMQISHDEEPIIVSEDERFASYNHTALVVKDLDASIEFYNHVFEFDTIHYPFPYRENIRAKWMSTGNGGELHLGEFQGDTTDYYYPGHIGLTVRSIDTIISRLEEFRYDIPSLDSMPNGERSIIISDLDGNNIHIIERKQ